MNRTRVHHLATLGLTAAKVGLQAGFFLLVPKAFDDGVAAALFLAFALQSFLCPTAALGSQFRLIKALATGATGIRSAITTAGIGSLICLVVAPLLCLIYAHAAFTPAALALYCVANYVRLFSDALAQGSGRYNVAQAAYIGFWGVKIAVVASVLIVPTWRLDFTHLSLLEAGLSLPWAITAGVWLSRRALRPSLGAVRWREELQLTLTTGSRSLWMEADRLILPIAASAAFYVDYNLIGRVATGAVTLVSAILASMTPDIVRAEPSELSGLTRRGRAPVALATVAYAVGAAVTICLYPQLRGEWLVALALAVVLPALVFWSHIYLDHVFYHHDPVRRLRSNLLGAGVVALASALCALHASAVVATLGVIGSYTITGLLARHWSRTLTPPQAGGHVS